MFAIGVQRRHRHDRDGSRTDKRLDVFHVAVFGVLDSGAYPKKVLRTGGAFDGQALEAFIGEHFALVDVIRRFGARRRDVPLQRAYSLSFISAGLGQLFEFRIDEHFDAAEKEARNRYPHVDAIAAPTPLFEAGNKCVCYLTVTFQAEQQGNVHIYAVGYEAADSRRPAFVAGNLINAAGRLSVGHNSRGSATVTCVSSAS